MISQDLVTDPLDHGSVPFHKRRERQLDAVRNEQLQQLGLGQPAEAAKQLQLARTLN